MVATRFAISAGVVIIIVVVVLFVPRIIIVFVLIIVLIFIFIVILFRIASFQTVIVFKFLQRLNIRSEAGKFKTSFDRLRPTLASSNNADVAYDFLPLQGQLRK